MTRRDKWWSQTGWGLHLPCRNKWFLSLCLFQLVSDGWIQSQTRIWLVVWTFAARKLFTDWKPSNFGAAMNPSLVHYDWLYGFAALIVIIMMLLCFAPMLGSGPRVTTCSSSLKSTTSSPARNDVPVDMVEMVSIPRSKPIISHDKLVRCPISITLLDRFHLISS